VRTAAAPAAMACGAYVAPCSRAPSMATNKSPGRTRSDARVMPVTTATGSAPRISRSASSSQVASIASRVRGGDEGRPMLTSGRLL